MARRSRGVLLPPVAASPPRRRDLYRALHSAIAEGAIPPRARLPSSRQTARDYGVSRGMVEEVFDQLVDEAFIERRVGRGTFVTDRRLVPRPAQMDHANARPSRRGLALVTGPTCREPSTLRPFNAGVAATTAFPWATWSRLQSRAASELGVGALGFADPRGVPELRASIASYLAQFRDLRCDAEQIVVFNSAQQAIFALALLLLESGDAVWLEDPCYPGARTAFETANARIVSVPVDGSGLRVEDARRLARRARMAYVTATHQYPTGAVLTAPRRQELLQWATANEAWIVDDDYDGEFRYDGTPRAPLAAESSDGRVLYVGTLSKSMFVSLRLAFAVVPEELVEPLATVRTSLDGFTPPITQLAMSMFIEEGHFATHLRAMRTVYGARRQALVDELRPLSGRGWTWPQEAAGLHLLLQHPSATHVRKVAANATELDLALLGGYRFHPQRGDGLFLRFAGLEVPVIQRGAEILVAADARAAAS